MRRGILIVLAATALASPALAQTIVGTEHDLSAALPTSQEICVFCHTPHQPDTPAVFDVDPLWNHTMSTVASYGVYASDTLNAIPGDIGGGTAVSNLCMSCHDGTVGIGSLLNEPNISGGEETPSNSTTLMSGNALLGTDLTNDHPINFIYDTALATADGELEDPAANTTVADLLFAGSLQCASCHDPHDDTFLPFLRLDNHQSGLCLTCHVK